MEKIYLGKKKKNSVYIEPKWNRCSKCNKKTPNRFGLCAKCLEENEIPDNCMGQHVTAIDFLD